MITRYGWWAAVGFIGLRESRHNWRIGRTETNVLLSLLETLWTRRLNAVTRKAEYNLQVNICDYLRWQYPGIPFQSDLSGIKLTMGQAVQAKKIKWGRGWPDLFIAQPRGGYAGLFLEIKTDESEIYTKRGDLRQSEHISEQADTLAMLRERGYRAEFACGFEAAKEMIDCYLRLEY